MRKLFSRQEKIFLGLALLVGLLIGAEYAIVRPVSQSLFLQAYGARALPWIWVYSLPFNLLIVTLYNRFLPKIGCLRFFAISALLVPLGNIAASFWIEQSSWVPGALYIWKEVYILLMLQQLWSVIHTTLVLQQAKYLYGVLFGFGAIGGFLGSLVPGFFAVQAGSERLLLLSGPIYLVIFFLYRKLLAHSKLPQQQDMQETASFSSLTKGCKLITSSKLLFAILLMTLCMQSTSTFTDFQFQSLLEQVYPDKDIRTEYFGRMLAIGNVLTMSCQFFFTIFCVRIFGMHTCHLLIPLVLMLTQGVFLVVPSINSMAACFLIIKCCDFSFFSVIKEMLYVHMRKEEKFQAKALIDVFGNRASKVISSLIVLTLAPVLSPSFLQPLSWMSLGIFTCWVMLMLSIKTPYQQLAKAP